MFSTRRDEKKITNDLYFRKVWELLVREKYREEFIEIYSEKGMRAEIFSNYKGYMKTELLQDRRNIYRFITIDYWETEHDYNEARLTKSRAYKELNIKCQKLTLIERDLGNFNKF